MRIHVHFGDEVPDLLLDNLLQGFSSLAEVTWWPPRPWFNAPAPGLRHPSIQCWGGGHEGGGAEPTAERIKSWRFDGGILVATHSLTQVALPAFAGTKIAIDAYDRPLYAWRQAAIRQGYTVFAREVPLPALRSPLAEIIALSIDFPFNPLWAPEPAANRDIPLIFAGDFKVGRRREYAEVLRSMRIPGAIIEENLSFADWRDAIARARVCVCAHGAGEKTYRLWEAAAAGCALLVERYADGNSPDCAAPSKSICTLFDGSTDLNEPGSIRAEAQTLAWRADLTQRLGAAAREEAWAHHTPQAAAQRVLSLAGVTG